MASGGPPRQQRARVANTIKVAEVMLHSPPLGDQPTIAAPRALPTRKTSLQEPSHGRRVASSPSPVRRVASLPSLGCPGRATTRPSFSHSDMRKRLQAVAAGIEKESKTDVDHLQDPVSLLKTSCDALLDYVSGKSDQLPGLLQGPADAKAAYNKNTTRAISAATAGAAATVLRPAGLPRRTRRGGWPVLTPGCRQPRHVATKIYEQPSGEYAGMWWLPVGVSVAEAAMLALGDIPRKITYDDDSASEDLSGNMMLAWWDDAVSKRFNVW